MSAGLLPPAAWGARRSPSALLAVLALHGVFGWLLLQTAPVREALVAAAQPLVVSLLAAPEPRPPAPRPLPAPAQARAPMVYAPVPEVRAVPTPAPAPAAATVPVPPAPPPAPAVIVAAVAPPASGPAPPSPKRLPANALQYLVKPAPAYPLASRRTGESGTVLLQVLVDEGGWPRRVLVQQSSGHARLDNAAVEAMGRARFEPYSEGGVAQAVWAPAPIEFVL